MKSTIVKIKNEDFTVPFPNVGQILEIEALKLALSKESYSGMVFSGTKSSSFALDLVDTIAHLSVLIPTLKDFLQIKSFSSIDAFLGKELVIAYKKNFLPWYSKICIELYNLDLTETADDSENKSE